MRLPSFDVGPAVVAASDGRIDGHRWAPAERSSSIKTTPCARASNRLVKLGNEKPSKTPQPTDPDHHYSSQSLGNRVRFCEITNSTARTNLPN